MAYLATLTIDRGRAAGLLATGGVAAGLSVHAIVAAFGLGALIGSSPLIYELLRWIGVGYILLLAWETWQVDDTSHRYQVGAVRGPLFWRGFLSNVFNPKSILFFVSVVPGLLVQLARLGVVYVAIASTIHARIVLLADQIRPRLMTVAGQRPIRRLLSFALLLVAVWLAWTSRLG
jgi:threonine/homoserine/homoserine lactone efflux protein